MTGPARDRDGRTTRAAATATAAALLALAAPSAQAAERRCGWFENPSPANYRLRDRDALWILSEMGGHEAEGMNDLGNYAAAGWAGDDPRGYGHGCACVTMDVDRAARRATRVRRVEPLPLSRCRADRSLPPPLENRDRRR